jgi:uncharacterized protein
VSKGVRTDFPRPIRVIENAWIPLLDGCRLAAKIWLPEDAEAAPVPGLLEYIPYRRRDRTAANDAERHPYLAGHGYACLRVDMRGSGDSDGILLDEYLPQEQDDAVEVIRWIAAQDWCTGAVGMFGISWGGFNTLQVAARRPPELKAVISFCSTDDRYATDVHYSGGCVLASDMLSWGSTMLAGNGRPPDPAVVGDRWREMWLARLEHTPPFVETWLAHQRRDAYWKQGSVCEDFAAIDCPVYMVGGWADPYHEAVFRLLEGYPGPRKGLIGPWAHHYPEDGTPGPAIGFLQESLRWWDHWLKGIDTGIMDEPMLRVWMQDAVEPRSYYDARPGRWVAETTWPPPTITARQFVLNPPDRLESSPSVEAPLEHSGSEETGRHAGRWWAFGNPGDFAPDQRTEDGSSLVFTSPPLEERLEILGFPWIRVSVAADKPRALLVARLCDVSPRGHSLLVSRALLNLTHREGHEEPSSLVPGERYEVELPLSSAAHAFPSGHRVRIAISPTYWPWAWPSPERVTLTVFAGERSRLELPVRAPRAEDAALPAFGPAEGSAGLRLKEGQHEIRRDLRVNVATGLIELATHNDMGGDFQLLDNGLRYEESNLDTFSIVDGDPLSARVGCSWTLKIGRGDWQTTVETRSLMSSDAQHFHLTNLLEAYEGNACVYTKSSTRAIPRDLV